MNLIDKYHLNNPTCKTRLVMPELVIATIAINILSLAFPIMVLQVYDHVMVSQNVDSLLILAIGTSIAIIVETILKITRSYITTWTGMVYEYTLAANAMYYYINTDLIRLPIGGIGEKIKNLGIFSKFRNFYSGQVLITLIDLPFAGIFLLVILYLAGRLVLVPLTLIIIFICITWFMGNKLMHALENSNDDVKYNFIIETLQGIHSIKSYGVEHVFQRRYEALEADASIKRYHTSFLSLSGNIFAMFFYEIMIVSVASFGAYLAINNEMSTGALVTTVLLSGKLMQPIKKSLLLWTQFQDYRIAYKKAENIFLLDQIKRSESSNPPKKLGNVELINLGFSYDNRTIFRNINLNINTPDIIAIHGANEVGKSTLLRLISGFSDPTSGKVLINGLPASSLSSEELVYHVGLIADEHTIFQGTIMENLTAFNSNKEDQAIEFSHLLDIDKEVALLPQGYETKINEGANIIAPGIKQRISIIRVLLNKPQIILFNNADKGLDEIGYNHLLNLIKKLKGTTTMIIVSNDNNFNKLADKHYLLENKNLTQMQNYKNF